MNYQEIIKSQQDFFNSNATKPLHFRKEQLKKFQSVLKSNEALLYKAIFKDFKKSEFETYATELGMIYEELIHHLKNIKLWSTKKYISTNLANFLGSSYIMPEPLGNVLVIGAWNYPYLLSLQPVISAMAAGNTVIIKPSELAPYTSQVMAKIINENFPTHYMQVWEGGIEETTEILKLRFDKIFYTGSAIVGKIVMKAAAEHLCPVILELGGKSPALVTKSASIKMTAKRLAWGKFLNGGQTCVAPDYILVDKSVKAKLIAELIKQIKKIHGEHPQKSEAFVRIINNRHYDRLLALLDEKKIIFGGETDEKDLYISPTIMDHIEWNDKVMQEEIFGPILPIIEYENLEEAIKQVKSREKPLALYLFTHKRSTSKRVFSELSFGGGGLNECIMHLTNPGLPFGGVGYSGMGNYHGENGFKAFSHQKSIIQKTNWFEPFVKYAPYNGLKLWLLKKLM
ncbi:MULTISPECIES: aldehyde dehydrogenase [unclassified Lentimicrobium]|uniref:aldehyde dehydrogenase n=1 Tax=unclassified Lentimicrobium TaxID=2677434 RepID=UPI0015543E4F|nr:MULTISPECIES: aldehyde dehydrogenase [unclassified Lentimicrobium]NPD45194.1 aldehyde dehydrogenase [Lentimicrobium sp. S6]NPD84473.1 aldehyde dehydrogenase [Lentimicrobium sp. L6]